MDCQIFYVIKVFHYRERTIKPEKLKTQRRVHEGFKLHIVSKSSFYIKHDSRNKKRAPIASTNHIYLNVLVYIACYPPAPDRQKKKNTCLIVQIIIFPSLPKPRLSPATDLLGSWEPERAHAARLLHALSKGLITPNLDLRD